MAKKTTTPPEITVKRTFTDRLPVNLVTSEITDRGRELARQEAELRTIEERKKQEMATFKAEIDEKTATVTRIAQVINQGWEHRDVECEERHIHAENRVVVVRLDTAEVIGERPMSEIERQRALPLAD